MFISIRNLTELYIDNNLLDALPGILLRLERLERLHRHGNHNYFKATPAAALTMDSSIV